MEKKKILLRVKINKLINDEFWERITALFYERRPEWVSVWTITNKTIEDQLKTQVKNNIRDQVIEQVSVKIRDSFYNPIE
jgi:hypothetical protein